MRPSLRALGAFPRLTLFTRATCGLCDTAKASIAAVAPRARLAAVHTVDIDAPGNERWHDLYAFDVPVVHFQPAEDAPVTKAMHHISPETVEKLLGI
ncbi:uncharacterized protein V1510DRAFT_371075 [Dipodascopsis tothii]|uniref:uncharacterized protein n=1 Tax=Dipodascopsis tothii TaxID=44089 RepID=UPI0034CECC72